MDSVTEVSWTMPLFWIAGDFFFEGGEVGTWARPRCGVVYEAHRTYDEPRIWCITGPYHDTVTRHEKQSVGTRPSRDSH